LKDTQYQESQSNKEVAEALRQKNQIQDDATNKLRMDAAQTNLELQQMRLELQQAMMNQILKVIPNTGITITTAATSKRTTSKNDSDGDLHKDKRINNQSTPAKKKLFSKQ
jgi:hypothetical protein